MPFQFLTNNSLFNACTHTNNVNTRTSSVCKTQGNIALAAMQIPRAAIVKAANWSIIGIKGPRQHALNKEGTDNIEISAACKNQETRYTQTQYRHKYCISCKHIPCIQRAMTIVNTKILRETPCDLIY